MAELILMRTPSGVLAPVDEETAAAIARLKMGQGVKGKFTRTRNLKFHRKFFALLSLAFDAWEAPELAINGMPAAKNRERFRKDLIVAAGHYEPVVSLKGELRAEPHSIAFDAMEEEDFEKLYDSVVTIVLQRILRNYTREDLDAVVENILSFAS